MCEENKCSVECRMYKKKKRNLDEVCMRVKVTVESVQKNSHTTDRSDFDYKDSLQHKGNSTVSI